MAKQQICASRPFRGPAGFVMATVIFCASAPAVALELAQEPGPEESGPARYVEALDATGPAEDGFERQVGAELVTFDSAATDALVATGWQPPAQINMDGFADHGERVRTFVGIAEALGLDPAIGAEQAHWGTPQENGLFGIAQSLGTVRYERSVAHYDLIALDRHREDVEAVLAELRSIAPDGDGVENTAETIDALVTELAAVDAQIAEISTRAAALDAEIARLAAESDQSLALANPAQALPTTLPAGWALVNLDVNGDAVVNQADLEAAQNGMWPEAHADGPSDG